MHKSHYKGKHDKWAIYWFYTYTVVHNNTIKVIYARKAAFINNIHSDQLMVIIWYKNNKNVTYLECSCLTSTIQS